MNLVFILPLWLVVLLLPIWITLRMSVALLRLLIHACRWSLRQARRA